MGRLADAMGSIFLGYAALHHFERNRHVEGLSVLAESALLQLETEAQAALREASDNFPSPVGSLGGWIMAAGIAPLGELMRPYRPPRDALTQQLAKLLSTPSAVHAMFAENVYMDSGGATGENRVAELIAAMPICLEADNILAACKKSKREPTEAEESVLTLADALRNKLVQVDVHSELGPLEGGEYVRPAIASTEARLMASAAANFNAARTSAAA